MIKAFFAGITIFGTYFGEILFLLLSGLSFGSLLSLFLFEKIEVNVKRKAKTKMAEEDFRILYVLFSGWAGIGLLAPLLSWLGWLKLPVVYFITFLGWGAFFVLYRRGFFARWRKESVQKYLWTPLVIFLFFLFLRLAYLDGLVLPPYSDSAEHFRRVKNLVSGAFSPLPYYHWGFHGIVAWAQVGTGNYSPLMMTFVTQFFLAVLPVSVYFMVLAFVDDLFAALFSALLAGIGWIIPAHATNFGKYPALVGVSLFPFFVGVAQLTLKPLSQITWKWVVYLLFVGTSIAWLHSRLFFLLLFFCLTWLIAFLAESKFGDNKLFITWTAAFSTLSITGMFFLSYGEEFSKYFRYYFGIFSNMTFFVLAFLPLAFRKYAKSIFQWSLFALFWIAATIVSLPRFLYRYELTLVDQPFFELSFFVFLATLGGFGIKSLHDFLQEEDFRRVFVFLAILLLLNGAFSPQPWFVMESSNYVTEADDLALHWMAENIEAQATVIIPSLQVNKFYLRGTDAGVWVKILAERPTLKLPYDYRWDTAEGIANICGEVGQKSLIYIYGGGGDTSFHLPACQYVFGLDPVFCEQQVNIYTLDCSLSQ